METGPQEVTVQVGDRTVVTITSVFPDIFFRVGCVQARSPRHEFFDLIREFGRDNIEPALFHKKLRRPDDLAFVFPERYMAVWEQQQFIHRLCTHPQVKEIKQVDLITSSPLVINSFFREQIRILTWSDDHQGVFT